ncbi:MAG: hypothetical protein IJW87_03390 [Clostridia bacterium]|nr:hypothetical protein [Clostridia bacterium]
MKCFKKLMAVALMLSLAFVICSCTPPQKVIDSVYDYLNEKYPDTEFQMGTVTQDTVTSGRYIIQVHAVTTAIDFEIFASNLIVTDGYGAKYANDVIFDQIKAALGEHYEISRVKNVQWIDIYEDGFSGYRFREMESTAEYDFREVKDIYRIELYEMSNAAEAVSVMQHALTWLNEAGADYESVTFSFMLEGEQILFTTNTRSAMEADAAELENAILSAEVEARSTTMLFTQHAEPKTVAFFIETEPVENAVIPAVAN